MGDTDALTVSLVDDKETVPSNADAALTVSLNGGTGQADITVSYSYTVDGATMSGTTPISAGQAEADDYGYCEPIW